MKSGWKTTEFWLTATLVIAALLDLAGPRLGDPWDLVAAAIAAAAYAVNRGLVKRGRSNADLQQQLVGVLAPLLGAGANGEPPK